MKERGAKRLIISSTLGVKDPQDKPDIETKSMVGLARFTMPDSCEDIIGTAESARNSDLDWTIVRPAILDNGERSGKVRVGYVSRGEVGTSISRADVADFMLEQLEDSKYLRTAPTISN